jgi:hypothetical protein
MEPLGQSPQVGSNACDDITPKFRGAHFHRSQQKASCNIRAGMVRLTLRALLF